MPVTPISGLILGSEIYSIYKYSSKSADVNPDRTKKQTKYETVNMIKKGK